MLRERFGSWEATPVRRSALGRCPRGPEPPG